MNHKFNSNPLRKRYAYLSQEDRKKRYAKRKVEPVYTLSEYWDRAVEYWKAVHRHSKDIDTD